ncbi:uncharacterized protein [Nicotiana sylvestris]|uniref:uncharacterized protein n=1 Tax=Nicotiana sylvestris TaxID=4096 RepID=UPI00388CDACB
MEVYFDDMLVKLAQVGDHFQHLFDTFQTLRNYNMKLNPEKCAFGMASVLKKQNQVEWTDEFQQALKDLKSYLSNPPLLAKPKDGERLLVYLAVSEVADLADVLADFNINLVPEEEKELQIVIKSAPQLVVNQMQGTYIAREARMQKYLEKVWVLVRQFQLWKAVQIPKEENVEADALANLAYVMEITNAENVIVIHLFHSALDQDKNKGMDQKDGVIQCSRFHTSKL